MLASVESSRVAFCEEPVAGVVDMARLAGAVPVAVAADESVRSAADAVAALQLGIDVIVVKPQALGGPHIATEIAGVARSSGACVVITSFLDSAVGVAHALHAAAAVDLIAGASEAGRGPARAGASASPPGDQVAASRAHGLATSGLLAADVAVPVPVDRGHMRLPGGAGLGLSPSGATAGA